MRDGGGPNAELAANLLKQIGAESLILVIVNRDMLDGQTGYKSTIECVTGDPQFMQEMPTLLRHLADSMERPMPGIPIDETVN